MESKNIALVIMAIIILLSAGFAGNNYWQEQKVQKHIEIYNEGVSNTVMEIVNSVINQGYIEITVPALNENNETVQAKIILIQYVEQENDENRK